MRKYKKLLTPQFGCDPIRLGLFPLRSPLLGESQLFSFPPLNDMLKFSGWSTTAQALKSVIGTKPMHLRAFFVPNTVIGTEPWTCMRLGLSTHVAFKGLVIRLILQFIRIIACCRVLHRLGNQDIHRRKLYCYSVRVLLDFARSLCTPARRVHC